MHCTAIELTDPSSIAALHRKSLQGMTAVFATWAHDQTEQVTAAGQEQVGTGQSADSDAWPEAWGTLGEAAAASPFSVIDTDKLTGGWEARAQTQKKLSVPPRPDYLSTLFSPLGHDAQVGFTLFEQYNRYTMYRVAAPDFDANEEYDGSYTRVPVGPVPRGYLTVAGVCFLRILKEYVVRIVLQG